MENLEDSATQNDEPNNEFIDNITLELLMNKGQYNKYISKNTQKSTKK